MCVGVCVLSLSLSSLDPYLRGEFLGEFFFFLADLQVLWLCGARVCVGGQVLVCSLTFCFVCVCVSICVCVCVSVCVCVCVSLSWIAVEICELNVQSLFVSFSLSLSTYISESLVLLKVLWCFGTVTFLVMIFLVLAIGMCSLRE